MSRYAALFGAQPERAQPSLTEEASRAYRLLIVDDEPNVLKALQRVFRQERYEIATAGDAAAAIALLQSQAFDLMITDYMMPGTNGGELLRQARELAPEMIRIMLTGHADTGAVMGAIKTGAVYKFILKPWNDDDLRVTVALALEQQQLIRKNKALKQDNAAKSKELSTALAKLAVTNRSQIAIMLHKRGLINAQQVQELHRLQQNRKEPVMRLILEKDWVPETQIHDILRRELLVDDVDLEEYQVDPTVAALIPHAFCERQCIVPLKLEGRRLVLAVADPLDMGLIEDLRFVTGLEIQTGLAPMRAIRAKIAEVYGVSAASGLIDVDTLVGGADPYEGIEVVIEDEDDQISLEELLHGTEEPPAIRLVNAVILEAIRLAASDIHVQPRAKNVLVRYRIDGVLQDKIQIPHQLHQSFVSRLKVMAELDISERRRPQDGRITVKTPMRSVDLRISTLPTISGEKIVMRLLDRNASVQGLEQLGFSERDAAQVRRVIAKPQGIVLATGPTGSGKTTTLYSLLQANATSGKNYVTIEDPVEYYLDMAGQVLIREKIGLTFPSVLRAILRQDPDVILLGEIRDADTAEVAFHAALTGHQVFSTLHTNSAVATISRLLDLGLKPYVIANALEGIVAQRLVRRLCEHCRTPAEEIDAAQSELGPLFAPGHIRTWRARGCSACNASGYKGRAGLFEVIVLDDHMRHLLATSASMQEITRNACDVGMRTLMEDAALKVDQGITSTAEVLRVLGPQ